MRIQDLEKRTGLERPSIRFYERQGLLTPQRAENGYREYSEEDVQQLLKIKLLRQLDMSVEKIRQLQQGGENFGKAMESQITHLSGQIEAQKRAKIICQTIRTDGVDYQSMDAEHYLKLLKELPTEEAMLGRTRFQEDIPQEIHPWRRYFARILDLSLFSMLMQFVIFVVFRLWSIPVDVVITLMGIGYGFLYLPVEALMLHKWGTTPGKWAMGIRLEWIQGGNLPYLEAIYRTWRVHKYGMAFGIPFVQLGFNSICYRKLTGRPYTRWQKYNEIDPPTEMDWDDDTEIIYSPLEGKWWLRLLLVAVVYALLFTVTVCDSIKPAHRSNDLTIAQFAENYNNTLRFINPDGSSYDTLEPDGSRTEVPSNVAVIYVGSTSAESERQGFVYGTDGEVLRSITYENSWEEVWHLQPLYGICQNAAITALLSQPGIGLPELWEFMKLWENHSDQTTGGFTYDAIEVQWSMDYQNLSYNSGIFFSNDPDAESTLHFNFKLLIHETE